MRALDEVKRLIEKIASGDLPPDEPLFTLRSQDTTAAEHVRLWAAEAKALGTPEGKIAEAIGLAKLMDAWPTKQIPGRPETRRTAAGGEHGDE